MSRAAGKYPIESKTVWVNIFMAAAGLYPPLQEWIKQNPDSVVVVTGLVNIVLRAMTKDKLKI